MMFGGREEIKMRPCLLPFLRRAGAMTAALAAAVLFWGCRAPAIAPAVGATETGIASWYGPGFHGQATSSRDPYDMYDATAAHNTLPFGTRVLVTNLDNGKSAIVRINDRGPFAKNRIIDLSYSAAYLLDMVGPGTARVRLEVLKTAPAGGRTRYLVQAGAFTSMDNARTLADGLAAEFPLVRVDEFRSQTGIYYRVRIPAESRRDALRIAGRLKDKGVPAIIYEGS
jgi:rare lipoprotein A